jgi:hypothetical protein
VSSSITFTDGGGAATLTNGKPVPADRFTGWTPQSPVVKAEADSLGTGQPFPFVFRTDYAASFSIVGIPNTSQATVLRLIRWLESGGVVTVNTGDASNRTYTSCYLPKGAHPSFTLSDKRFLEYTLSLTLVNVAAADMLAIY